MGFVSADSRCCPAALLSPRTRAVPTLDSGRVLTLNLLGGHVGQVESGQSLKCTQYRIDNCTRRIVAIG